MDWLTLAYRARDFRPFLTREVDSGRSTRTSADSAAPTLA